MDKLKSNVPQLFSKRKTAKPFGSKRCMPPIVTLENVHHSSITFLKKCIPAISKLTDIYSGDYPSNKIAKHREHTCYFQKVGTKREKT
ncbi:hypothetical protein Hanom_Chr13g01236421 [Helianthus anomalus]